MIEWSFERFAPWFTLPHDWVIVWAIRALTYFMTEWSFERFASWINPPHDWVIIWALRALDYFSSWMSDHLSASRPDLFRLTIEWYSVIWCILDTIGGIWGIWCNIVSHCKDFSHNWMIFRHWCEALEGLGHYMLQFLHHWRKLSILGIIVRLEAFWRHYLRNLRHNCDAL